MNQEPRTNEAKPINKSETRLLIIWLEIPIQRFADRTNGIITNIFLNCCLGLDVRKIFISRSIYTRYQIYYQNMNLNKIQY